MTKKSLFDTVSFACSRVVTQAYSTSFFMCTRLLSKEIRPYIYGIYGFVRAADEIVDSFHNYDQRALLAQLKADTYQAIENRISLNPVLNTFQNVVNKYGISLEFIHAFFESMEKDLDDKTHNADTYSRYIYGSAEAVGLMCLKVMCDGNQQLFEQLQQPARKLGSAFQKVNFLRDISADNQELGRMYFPGISFHNFCEADKKRIEQEIDLEFREAYKGIIKLPVSCRTGVYLAFRYYRDLLHNICKTPAIKIMQQRIRVSDVRKMSLFANLALQQRLKLL